MDFKNLLSQVLNSGTSMLNEKRARNVPSQNSKTSGGNSKNAFYSMGAGALAGGVISLLMGSKKGRKVAGTAAGVGGGAAIGALALKVYKDWKGSSPEDSGSGTPVVQMLPESEERKSLNILRAMIAAAKADGHVDETEKNRIHEVVKKHGVNEEISKFVEQELNKPLDLAEIARAVKSPEEAAEVYLASLLVADEQNFMEKAYLQELAKQLKLESSLVARLEAQVS